MSAKYLGWPAVDVDRVVVTCLRLEDRGGVLGAAVFGLPVLDEIGPGALEIVCRAALDQKLHDAGRLDVEYELRLDGSVNDHLAALAPADDIRPEHVRHVAGHVPPAAGLKQESAEKVLALLAEVPVDEDQGGVGMLCSLDDTHVGRLGQ